MNIANQMAHVNHLATLGGVFPVFTDQMPEYGARPDLLHQAKQRLIDAAIPSTNC